MESNKLLNAFLHSVAALLTSSNDVDISPCFSITSSIPPLMSFNIVRYCNPASSPGPPKMSAIAVPTLLLDSGNSESFCETSCMTCQVVFAPLCKSSCTFLLLMPMPSSALAVAVVISLNRRLPSFIASTPLSLKMPSWLLFAMIATKSDALIPASLK